MQAEILSVVSGTGKTSKRPFNLLTVNCDGVVGKVFASSESKYEKGQIVTLKVGSNREMFLTVQAE